MCGGGSRPIGPNPDYPGADVVRCRSCGLWWTHPLPPAEDRSEDYDGRYVLHHDDELPPHYLPHKDARASAQHRFVHRHTDLAAASEVPVLDVGCGVGSLLRAFAADPNVTDLVGIEPSAVMRARAAARLPERAELLGGLFTPSAVGGRQFALATGSHVLEHVPDPVPFLAALRTCVRPGGSLFLEVPRESVRSVRAALAAGRSGPMHVVFFDRSTLVRACSRAGWEPVHAEAVGPSLDAFSVVPDDRRSRRARSRRASAAGGPVPGSIEAFDHPNDPDGAWLRIVARNPSG